MSNRRKLRRRRAECDLFVFDSHSDEPLGRIKDMTTKGMMLHCSVPVREQKEYSCRMTLPEKVLKFDEIEFEVVCRWTQPSLEPGIVEAGFEFQGLSEKEQVIIAMLIAPWPEIESRGVVASFDAAT